MTSPGPNDGAAALDASEPATPPAEGGSTAAVEARRLLPYRPAVDGLRAVAVAAVVIYHAAPTWAPSGWLGVDVFFVISGFLITALLLVEFQRWRDIDLIAFWAARARRLLPAVIVLVLATLVASAAWSPANRREAIAGDGLASIFYVANWRFLFSDEAYFAGVAAPSPLRHMWSLAVEEQFYLLFPLLMLFLLRRLTRRTQVVGALLVIAGASLAVSVLLYEPGVDPARVYYGTDTRAHELLLGAAAAALTIRATREGVSRRLLNGLDRWVRVLSPVALVLVVAAFAIPGGGQSLIFRGGSVVLSVLVCIVLLAAVSSTPSPVSRLLALPPLRLLGLISYGVYLWHWPVIVFLDARRLHVDGPLLVLVQVGLSLLLAVASHHLVEKRIRRRGVSGLVPGRPELGWVVAVLAIPAVAVAAWSMPPLAARLVPQTVKGPAVSLVSQPYAPGREFHSVTVIGNSIPMSLMAYFDSARYPDLVMTEATNLGCDPLPDPKVEDGAPQPISKECLDWQRTWPSVLAANKADTAVVFISQSWVQDREVDGRRLAFGTPEYRAYLHRELDSMARRIAEQGTARMGVVNVACHDIPTFKADVAKLNDIPTVTELNTIVADWAEKNEVPVIDQFGLLCADGYRDGINGTPLYVDGLHFTEDSAKQVWPWFAAEIQAVAQGRTR